jgi:hypothetical protein
MSSGKGTIKKTGDKERIGGAVCGETFVFHVSGNAELRLEYWFPWGKAPLGVCTITDGTTLGRAVQARLLAR